MAIQIKQDDLTNIVHEYIRKRITEIIAEETKKAQDEVGKKIVQLIPDVTTSMIERLDFSVCQKQIIFTIKPKL